MPLSQFRM